jgi:hypothetical protein
VIPSRETVFAQDLFGCGEKTLLNLRKATYLNEIGYEIFGRHNRIHSDFPFFCPRVGIQPSIISVSPTR